MTIKSQSRTLGRMIRRMTGIPLPTAMKIGRMAAQLTGGIAIQERFPEAFTATVVRCGDDNCCSWPEYTVIGNKGKLITTYDFSPEKIKKEFDYFIRHSLD